MQLSIITGTKNIASLMKNVKNSLIKNVPKQNVFTKKIAYHGGYVETTCYWHASLNLWCVLDEPSDSNKYWYAFGLADASQKRRLSITCEINVPKSGFDRRIGGLIAKDAIDNYYLCHNGKIGGGAKGVGKEAFWNLYRGQSIELIGQNVTDNRGLIIGEIYDENLPNLVAQFAHEVRRIKDAIRSGALAKPSRSKKIFTPEFEGARAPYSLDNTVNGIAYHGIVVNTLRMKLENLGYKIFNDRRDLVIETGNRISAVFEIKTSIDTTSCYTAIGQLLMLNAFEAHQPKLVAAFPGRPSSDTKERFDKLGISLLSYTWDGDVPEFDDLNYVLS